VSKEKTFADALSAECASANCDYAVNF
jgi:hypothetical protein